MSSLSRDHCLQLLATETTGRLFVLQRPVYPLSIHFRLSESGLVIDPPPAVADSPTDGPQLVMVAVDRLDPDEMHGWSLVVVGSLLLGSNEGDERTEAGPGPAFLDLRSLTGKSFTTSPAPRLEFPSAAEAGAGPDHDQHSRTSSSHSLLHSGTLHPRL